MSDQKLIAKQHLVYFNKVAKRLQSKQYVNNIDKLAIDSGSLQKKLLKQYPAIKKMVPTTTKNFRWAEKVIKNATVAVTSDKTKFKFSYDKMVKLFYTIYSQLTKIIIVGNVGLLTWFVASTTYGIPILIGIAVLAVFAIVINAISHKISVKQAYMNFIQSFKAMLKSTKPSEAENLAAWMPLFVVGVLKVFSLFLISGLPALLTLLNSTIVMGSLIGAPFLAIAAGISVFTTEIVTIFPFIFIALTYFLLLGVIDDMVLRRDIRTDEV